MLKHCFLVLDETLMIKFHFITFRSKTAVFNVSQFAEPICEKKNPVHLVKVEVVKSGMHQYGFAYAHCERWRAERSVSFFRLEHLHIFSCRMKLAMLLCLK